MSKIIMYHYIRKFKKDFPFFKFLNEQDFKKQLIFFKKKNSFFSLNDTLKNQLYKNHFLLTFDDGLKEHLKIAKYLHKKKILAIFFISSYPIKNKDFLPIHKIHLIFGRYDSDQILKIFQKFNIKLKNYKNVFKIFKKQKEFISSKKNFSENNKKIYLKTILNNIDQSENNIIDKIFNYCFSKYEQKKIFKEFYLSKNDIIKIDKLGMLVGSHGHRHRVLSKLKKKDQIKDIKFSIDTLSKILKKKINLFCYPYGGFNMFTRDTIKILKDFKIEYSFNVESKNCNIKSNNFYLPRFDCNEYKFGKLYNYKL